MSDDLSTKELITSMLDLFTRLGDDRHAHLVMDAAKRLETQSDEIDRLRAENERLKREVDVAQDNMNFITRQERDWR